MDDERDVAAPGDADLSPEEMLALIDGQTRGVRRAFTAQVPVYYFVWGGAWLVGYLVLWSGWEGTTSPVQLPLWIGAIVFGLLILGAAVTSAVVGVRANRGIKGVSDFVGTLYGLSWPILGTAFAAVGVAIQRAGASSDVTAIYYTSAYALLAGGMYLAGAMIWRSVDQLVIALILIVAAAVTGFFGAPANMLAMALIVGPALIVGGIVSVVRLRRL